MISFTKGPINSLSECEARTRDRTVLVCFFAVLFSLKLSSVFFFNTYFQANHATLTLTENLEGPCAQEENSNVEFYWHVLTKVFLMMG